VAGAATAAAVEGRGLRRVISGGALGIMTQAPFAAAEIFLAQFKEGDGGHVVFLPLVDASFYGLIVRASTTKLQ
jgi:hypothetical protein